MKHLIFLAILLCFFISCGGDDARTTAEEAIGEQIQIPSEDAAVEAAQEWLALIDSGRYAESWENTSDMFRNAVDQEQWVQQMQALRKPMGDVKSREVRSTEYKTSLSGAPDGEYVVILFNSSFTNKQQAVETVTPMKSKTGEWKVSGYYIR
ncbi:MAG: DUF4019 domain-containing protein [Calditrichaeota bacterium]|nr:MAG: DUF4019 domain-containing protein [Calditrichota bacterium]